MSVYTDNLTAIPRNVNQTTRISYPDETVRHWALAFVIVCLLAGLLAVGIISALHICRETRLRNEHNERRKRRETSTQMPSVVVDEPVQPIPNSTATDKSEPSKEPGGQNMTEVHLDDVKHSTTEKAPPAPPGHLLPSAKALPSTGNYIAPDSSLNDRALLMQQRDHYSAEYNAFVQRARGSVLARDFPYAVPSSQRPQ